MHLSHNTIRSVSYFSNLMSDLIVLDFDSNQIETIQVDAFLNCRKLEHLYLSNNNLANLTKNNFFYLLNLKNLNVSFNRIHFVEMNSFQNLNRLEWLDLSFNRLKSIENHLLSGLTSLLSLHLMGNMSLFNKSLTSLTSISHIYLNASVIQSNKCVFMFSVEREMQRNIMNKFLFFRSINLVAMDYLLSCELTFHLLQFNIHLNLKSDAEFERFADLCKYNLIKKANNYKNSYMHCFSSDEIQSGDEMGTQNGLFMNKIERVVTNVFFLVVMCILFLLLVPYCVLIFLLRLPYSSD